MPGKVLIIDDDHDLLAALKEVLEKNSYDVHCSDEAQKAVQMVAETSYDVILVDYKMPVNDGLWFMENAKIPRKSKVLLSTAFATRELIAKMFSLGASGYLLKPYDEAVLLRHLSYYCK